MSVRIVCITKDNGNHENPHLAITNLGWVGELSGERGRITRLEMYNWIKDKQGVAYVVDSMANKVYVSTAISRFGNPYVRTISDGRETNNLLNLPEC